MKRPYLIPALLLTAAFGCNHPSPKEAVQPVYAFDSFTVKGMDNFELNDVSLADSDRILRTFTTRHYRTYQLKHDTYQMISDKLPDLEEDDFIRGVDISPDGSLTLSGVNKVIYRFDSSGRLRFKSLLPNMIDGPGIDSHYMMTGSRSVHPTLQGDTITGLLTSTAEDMVHNIADQYHYPLQAAFVLRPGDTALPLYVSAPKPAALQQLHPPSVFAAEIDGAYYTLFDPLDTLYRYNGQGLIDRKIPLNNPYYHLPAPFDRSRIWDNAYKNRYELDNFSYSGMIYNTHTRHLLLFFTIPPDTRPSGDLLAFEDLQQVALVLDREFHYLRTIKLQGPLHYLMYYLTARGIAIPRLDQKTEDEQGKIVFDLFDL